MWEIFILKEVRRIFKGNDGFNMKINNLGFWFFFIQCLFIQNLIVELCYCVIKLMIMKWKEDIGLNILE